MQYGPDRMIGFQIFIGDSAYYHMLGLERLHDNHLATREGEGNVCFVNQYALQVLGIAEDATNFKVGENYTYNYDIAGVYRDFQVGTALDELQPVLLEYYGSSEEFLQKRYPWNVLVKTRGDKSAAYNTVKSVFERVSEGGIFSGAMYIEQQLEADYAQQRRILHIVGIFTLVAILISALGMVAMSTLLYPAEGAGGRRPQGLRFDARRGAHAPGGQLHAAGRRGFRHRRARGVVPARTLVAGL